MVPVLELTLFLHLSAHFNPHGLVALLWKPGRAGAGHLSQKRLHLISYLQILSQNQDSSFLLSYILFLQSAEHTDRHPWAFRGKGGQAVQGPCPAAPLQPRGGLPTMAPALLSVTTHRLPGCVPDPWPTQACLLRSESTKGRVGARPWLGAHWGPQSAQQTLSKAVPSKGFRFTVPGTAVIS